MKRMIMMVVAMLSMTMTFAENENAASVNNVEAYDMQINIRKLASALSLTSDQVEAVEDIHRTFNAEMMVAAQANKDERAELVDKAIKKDVRYMHYVLDQKQYRTYLMLLNATLINRGLK